MKKILIIQHKMIGDVLICSLLCENIKKHLPNVQIDYLVNKNTLPVLENNPYIDNLIVFDEKSNKGLTKILKFAQKVNHNQYDVIIDAYSKLISWITVFMNRAAIKISYKKVGRTFLYTHNIKKHFLPKSNLGLAIEHRLALLKPLGIEKPMANFPKLYTTEKEKQFAYKEMTKHGVDFSRKTVMISLLGSDPSKTLPLSEMTKTVEFIGQNYAVNILFNYFPAQLPQAQQVYDALSQKVKEKVYFNLFGNDLRSFIALMENCDLIVGNDGGAINMAKALGKKSFIIFSPWIEKKVWASLEDGTNHISTHLADFLPEKLAGLSQKEIKKQVHDFYKLLTFDLFEQKLNHFLAQHLTPAK